MKNNTLVIPKLDWQDSLKAFALLGILLNHLVEEVHKGPLFTGFENFSPIRLLAWIGDFGPGVFILCSGIGLTWSALHRNEYELSPGAFYKRRLLRIFPLYMGLHLILLALAIVTPESVLREHHAYPLSFAHPKMLLSILGLRFTDSLFFFISPSWWFVWLVIQLYLIFPALYLLMRRIGIQRFLLTTLAITLVCRATGILFPAVIPWKSYFWLLGIFFGTRLVEFCAGMGIAYYLKQSHTRQFRFPSPGAILSWCLPLLICGLTAQLYPMGKIISYPLISLTLAGIFYAIWQSGLKKIPALAAIITWIGVESYAVFLIHQPPLQLTKVFSRYSEQHHLFAAICVLFMSFPAGWLVSKMVAKLKGLAVALKGEEVIRLLSILVGIGVGMTLVFIDMPTVWGWKHRAYSLALGLAIVFLVYAAYSSGIKEKWPEHLLRGAMIVAGLLKISIFHSHYGSFIALGIGFLSASIAEIFQQRLHSRWRAWSVSLAGLVLVIIIFEPTFRAIAPGEYGVWGELPVLQEHPTRTYSLKPNLEKRLRYFPYDYVVRTNSVGLVGPEIDIKRPTADTLRILIIGDAFSMPVGLEYPDAYPALLEKQIAKVLAPRNVQVINAGVTGYGPMEQTPQLRELGTLFKPDIVVYQFFVNEIGSVNRNQGKVRVGIGLIPCFVSGYCNFANRSQLAHRISKIGNYFVKKIIGDRRQAKRHFKKAFIRYYQVGNNPLYSEENLEKLYHYLNSMNTVCNSLGARLVVYFVPAAIAVSKPSDLLYFPRDQDLTDKALYDFSRPFRMAKKIIDRVGMPFVDLTDDLRSHPNQPVYFPNEIHWNKEGHRVGARVIANDLIRRGWLGLKMSATRPCLSRAI